MIRWTFFFTNDKHISVDVSQEAEDIRIQSDIESGTETLFVPSADKEVYVNLVLVTVISREEIKATAPIPETPTEPNQPS